MYSANMSLQRIFYDGFNTRNAELVNVTNPGETKKAEPTSDGIRPYATPFHEKLAIALLAGSVILVFLCFGALPLLFRDNYDSSWEHDLKAKAANYGQAGTVTSMTHLLQR